MSVRMAGEYGRMDNGGWESMVWETGECERIS